MPKAKRVLNNRVNLHEAALLVEALELNDAEWQAVIDAAEDAHLTPKAYCRIMVLAAAGMGGIVEHLERAIAASGDASDLARPPLPPKRTQKRRGRA